MIRNMLGGYDSEAQSEGSGLSLAFLLFSLITAAILLSLFVLVASPALGHGDRTSLAASKAVRPASRASSARTNLSHNRRTVVYLVSSQAEAAKLDDALNEWHLEIQALGIESEQPQRVVVVQTADEVLHQRIIDFGILATQAPGLEMQVIDLRQ